MIRSNRCVRPIFTLIAVLQEPLVCLQTIVPLFLLQELDASAIHIALLTSILPAVAILSFYWGSLLHNVHSGKVLRTSLITSTALAPILFAITIYINNPWAYIIASGWYALFLRASHPARMEILKRLFPQEQCNEFFSSLFRVSYSAGMILAPILGLLCDTHLVSLRWLFIIGASFHLFSALLYIFIRPSASSSETEPVPKITSFLLDPWKHSHKILRENTLFRRFQVGFFIAGSGLMIAKPAGEVLLSKLHLPYLLIFICRTLLKGSGTIGSSKIWSKHLSQKSVLSVSSFVAVGFLLSQIFLLGSLSWYYSVFFAYAIYGIAQGGSQLIWHLSGPLLSGKESSCQYSSVNILAVGVRGAAMPLLGGMLLHSFGIIPTMWISTLILLFGALYLQKQSVLVPARV